MRNRTRVLFASLCVCVGMLGTAAGGDSPKGESKSTGQAQLVPAQSDVPQVDLRELRMLDVRGGRHDLAVDDTRGTVFIFLSSECPISRQYVPELNRLAKTAAELKLAFYGVVSDAGVTRVEARKFVDEFHVGFPVLFDASRELVMLF